MIFLESLMFQEGDWQGIFEKIRDIADKKGCCIYDALCDITFLLQIFLVMTRL